MNAPATAIQTVQQDQDPKSLALLKAIGFDKLSEPERELALNIASRYELDPLLRHLVMIDGRVYITRDGLLHIAHRSKQLDGIEVSEVKSDGKYLRCICTVYRKDMTHPFAYRGRYPVDYGNKRYSEEMAIKVSEVMALRRAFNVAAPTLEERWENEEGVPVEPPPPPSSLAAKVAAKAAEIAGEPVESEPVPGDASNDARFGEVGPRPAVVAEKAAEVAPTLGEATEALSAKVDATLEELDTPENGISFAEFRALFSKAEVKPTKAAVVTEATRLFPEQADELRMQDTKDWRLRPSQWALLADALGLA